MMLMLHRNTPRNPGPVYKLKWRSMASHSTPSSPSGWNNKPNANGKKMKKRQETVDYVPGPKVTPNACIVVKNDITVVRSFSQVAAEQYEREITMYATKAVHAFTSSENFIKIINLPHFQLSIYL